jgi:hypothetical protein
MPGSPSGSDLATHEAALPPKRRPAGRVGASVFLAVAFAFACSRDVPLPLVDAAPPPSAAPAPASASAAPPAFSTSPSPARYPFDRTHSPIDANVARRLREIAARDPSLRADVFAKVGDSMTASDDFMRCFARPKLELGEHSSLMPVIERFRATDSFRRRSEAARIGWSAWQVLEGNPSPIEREVTAIRPRFALLQFGTNDLELGKMKHFALRLLDVTGSLIARGVIPILFTIPRRRDSVDRDVWVPRYNAVVRVIAQSRQVPLVDYHRELLRLPGQGMAKDGIHPSTYKGPRGRDGCAFDADGLRHGYNLRNLLSLRALERALHALSDTSEPLDPMPPPGDALRIAQPPFVDARRAIPRAPADARHGCSGVPPALDHELVYTVDLSRRTALRATVFASANVETALALVRRSAPQGCVSTGREAVATSLPPGSYELVVSAKSATSAPEIFLTVLAD